MYAGGGDEETAREEEEEEEEEEAAGWHQKTRTPHRDVGNYTSISPKQQEIMLPRRSRARKNPLVAPFLKKNERKEGREAPEPEPGTRRNQKIMMEHNPFPEKSKKRKAGRQTPEP